MCILTLITSTSLEYKATLSSKFSRDTISMVSQFDICDRNRDINFDYLWDQQALSSRLTLVSNLLNLNKFGDTVSFFCSFIREASTSSEGWMALK